MNLGNYLVLAYVHACLFNIFLICNLLRIKFHVDCVGLSAIQSNDPECYFFSRRNYKYSKSQRANRTTGAGYWKGTGRDRTITAKSTGEQIATKKTLVFYNGRVPNGVKTNWIMHEYNPTFSFPNKVCSLSK